MRAPKLAMPRTEGHTVARSSERHRKAMSFRIGLKARGGTCFLVWQLSRPPSSHCGNPLEILWEAMIDGIHAAPVWL